MTIRRLGRLPIKQDEVDTSLIEAIAALKEQLRIQNDYLALMNNTEAPPQRTDTYDTDTVP